VRASGQASIRCDHTAFVELWPWTAGRTRLLQEIACRAGVGAGARVAKDRAGICRLGVNIGATVPETRIHEHAD
jgi:hypothetical protein